MSGREVQVNGPTGRDRHGRPLPAQFVGRAGFVGPEALCHLKTDYKPNQSWVPRRAAQIKELGENWESPSLTGGGY